MVDNSKAIVVFTNEQEQERLNLLANYHPQDHLMKWVAFNKATGRNQEVVYYPASWRLYELNLRFPLANFENEIVHMDATKDFVIIRSRLFFGEDYNKSPKRAQALKQGKLSEVDRVETKAMARAARNFGIGTEHALDMDELEADTLQAEPTIVPTNPAPKVKVVEADKQPTKAAHTDKTVENQNVKNSEDLAAIPSANALMTTAEALGLSWSETLSGTFKKGIDAGKIKLSDLLSAGSELPPNYCKTVSKWLDATAAEPVSLAS